ncbi:MAG TPA: cupredoxin domain-containing protein [Candidatus Saccharimonadales bacterium]|nr:cupredoxin domain-containing protein [Candidatus Saccharimonadales bacterium]
MEHSQDNGIVMGSFNTSMRGPSNKKAWLILGGIALVVALVIGLIIFGMNKKPEAETDSSVPISENVASVNLEITGVTPTTVKVKKGQQVTFTNHDTRAHKLTADQTVLAGFDSNDLLATGDSYTYIFETPGNYKYYDPADAKGFNGTVVVE